MATIYLTLSAKTDTNPQKEIRVRFKHGIIDQQAKTNIFIPAEHWNNESKQIIVPNFRVITAEKKELVKYLTEQSEKLNELVSIIQTSFNEADKKSITPDWLKTVIDKHNFPNRTELAPMVQTFFESFDEFLQKRPLSEIRKKNFRVIVRALQRYELYTCKKMGGNRDFSLSFDRFTPDMLRDLTDFLKKENEIRKEYPELYELCPEYHDPKPRGQNTINDILTKLRTLFLWAVESGKTANNPFRKFSVEDCVYGTPYYISVDERNKLYKTDLSHRPALETQRDIFVFQCLIGCRVSDLYKFTKQNVINGAIEYIARKTKDGRPVTVKVPLNAIAREILNKYADYNGETLLPYISDQKYNKAIKEAFTIAGLTRMVITLDPLTREGVVRPLNEIASSHLARRCFVGNLYKHYKDPNIVASLSGHKEGSRAFARYRDIDDTIKIEAVKILE